MSKKQKRFTSKYPRTLAEAETRSRRNYTDNNFQITPETDSKLLSNPGAFSLQNAYPYIFDGLTALCTDFANKEFIFTNAGQEKRMKVIQGQDEEALTHYQAIVPIEVFKDLALNGHNEYWGFLEKELYAMFKKPEKRVLPFASGLLIATSPIMVDFIYEDGTKASIKKSLENIGADRKIKYLILRFFKPLFASILQKNNRGGIANSYLQMPRAFQAEISASLKELELRFKYSEAYCPPSPQDDIGLLFIKSIVEKYNKNPELAEENGMKWTPRPVADYMTYLDDVCSLSAIEARDIFLFFALHDDRHSPVISINKYYDDFLQGVFPGYVETRKSGKKYIKPKYKKLVEKKINGFIWLCKIMANTGKLNGAQFLPLNYDNLTKRITIRRDIHLCYNNQPEFNFITG